MYSQAKGKSAVFRIDPSCVKDSSTAFCIPTIYSVSDTCDTSFIEDLLKKGLWKC